MTSAITDFNQFSTLRVAAENNDPEVLREVAGQFEALFVQTVLKNMREASLGDPLLGDSNQHEMYQGMLDQQLALEMSSGKGIGLAEMLVRQLGGDSGDSIDSSQRSQSGYSLTETRSSQQGYNLSPLFTAPKSYPLPDTGSIQRGFQLPESSSGQKSYPLPVSSPIGALHKPGWSDAESFARDVWPHAERAAARLNVAPEAIVAQAALETGWGKHVPQRHDGSSSFNLFGIKANNGWSGDKVSKATLEFKQGVPRPEIAQFRAYNDMAATFADYSEMLMRNPRYQSVSDHGSDIAGFAQALQSSGYATDPAYAQKLERVADSETMKNAISKLKVSGSQPITGRQLPDAI